MKTIANALARIAVFGGFCLLLVFGGAAFSFLVPIWHLVSPDYLSTCEVCQRWGEQPLDIAAFRSAEEDEATRAAMACSLLRTQDDYVGMHRLEIRPLFGDPDGYYYTEIQPAYLIETAKTMGEDSWQIVFLIDRDRNVRKVVVHKNCC